MRWISDGCPGGVMEGHSHKVTASALSTRGLIAVSKKGGVWRAAMTDSGHHYLEHGDFPLPAQTPALRAPRPEQPTTAPVPKAKARPSASKPPKLSASGQLVAAVIAAGGVLTIDTQVDTINYDARVDAANRWNKVPAGTQLVHRRIGSS